VLAQRANAELLLTTASLVSPDANEVACSDGTALPYDVLSIDVGRSRPSASARRRAPRGAHAAARARRRRLERRARARRARQVGAVTVVGAGAAGIEIALAMRHRFNMELRDHRVPHVRIVSEAAGTGSRGRGAQG
jgi:NADH dehydrogenase FAD-containing subunit